MTQPAAIPIKAPVGEDGFPGEIFAKAALPTGPEIVARVVAVEIRISRFLERQRIAGVQDVQRERVLGREIIFNLGGDVVVARIELVVTALHFECEVGVAATGGGQPTSATLRKRALIRSPDAGKAQAEGSAGLQGRAAGGFHREHCGEAVAELGGEPPGHQIDAGDRGEIDDGERTVDVLEVKWLDQIDAVEAGEHLGVGRAAHPEFRGEIIGGEAGEAGNGAVKIFAELGQGGEIRCGERGAGDDGLARNPEAARGDDKIIERDRRGFGGGDYRCDTEGSECPRDAKRARHRFGWILPERRSTKLPCGFTLWAFAERRWATRRCWRARRGTK